MTPEGKYKILLISDHAASCSGVGLMGRFLGEGLVKKGRWTIRQFGAAIKHADYNVMSLSPDFVIKPIDGFGNPDLLRVTLVQEKPDVVMLFTDPRFYEYLIAMEDEIHQLCPIVWWTIWDNKPTPHFNAPIYKSIDLLNCISDLTHQMITEIVPQQRDQINFIPHAFPPGLYYPLPDSDINAYRRQILGSDKEDHFVGIWINRNAKRKRPADVLESWKLFLDRLQAEHGHKKAVLIMHTDPLDMEGPNLHYIVDTLGIGDTVIFSNDRLEFEKINVLHNISDFCINLSYAEGFGLATLEAMMCGNPIVAVQTGGMARQVVDVHDGTPNGIPLPVELKTLVGSQSVPVIYEDYCTAQTASDGIYQLYQMGEEQRKQLGAKARKYALQEFNYQSMIDRWDETLFDCIRNWKSRRRTWEKIDL